MTLPRPPPARVLFGLGLCISVAALGCRRADDASDRAGAETELRRVELQSLEDYPESVRAQLRGQYGRLQELTRRRDADPAELGVAYGTMGGLLLAYGLSQPAEPALLNAADLLPEDVRWPYYLGFLYKSTGRLPQAVRQLERALALRPEDVPTSIHLAEAYIELGREADAKALLNDALRVDPSSAAAHFLLGHIAGLDDPSEAIAHYEAVLRLQPDASVVHYPLGLAYRQQGDLEKSQEHLAQRGDIEIAVRDPLLEALQRMKTGPEANMVRGTRLMKQRRFREAAAAFEEVVAEDSANLTAYLNVGVAYARLGDSQRAIEALEQAVRVGPSNSRVHYNLGLLYGGRGEDQKALEHYQAAVDADPSNSDAHYALARLMSRARRCREAIPHFEDFLAAGPGNVEARVRQAMCHAQLSEYAEARALLEAGYEAFPAQLELQDALIRVLAASPDESVRDGERALEMGERLAATVRRPETLESLAMAYAEVGRFPEAIRAQRAAIRAAQEQGMPAYLDFLRSALRRYERGEPSRTPWPPAALGG